MKRKVRWLVQARIDHATITLCVYEETLEAARREVLKRHPDWQIIQVFEQSDMLTDVMRLVGVS